MYMKILVRIKNCLVLIIILLSQNIKMDDLNTLVVGKMIHGMDGAAIKEYVGLKPKMYLSRRSNSSEYKKQKT